MKTSAIVLLLATAALTAGCATKPRADTSFTPHAAHASIDTTPASLKRNGQRNNTAAKSESNSTAGTLVNFLLALLGGTPE